MRRHEKEGVIYPPEDFRVYMCPPSKTFQPMARFGWDLADHWLTAAEWLAWLRRKGEKKRVLNGHVRRYELRPQISCIRYGVHNVKLRRLP